MFEVNALLNKNIEISHILNKKININVLLKAPVNNTPEETIVIQASSTSFCGLLAEVSSVLWTPARLIGSGLAAWYDAEDTATLIYDGSNNLSQWNDKSGNNRNIVQGTGGYQPNYNPYNKEIYFNGVYNQHLFIDTSFMYGLSGGCIVYAVIKGAPQTSKYIISERNNASTNANYVTHVTGAASVNSSITPYYRNNANSVILNNDVSYGSVFDSNYNIIGSIDSLTNFTYSINGTNSYRNTAYSRSTTTVNRFVVGASYSTTVSAGFTGYIKEIIINPYSTSINEKLEGYLAHKWGLTANLAVDHPYKNSPPVV